MTSYIILNKLNQNIYTGSILNVLDNPSQFYIIWFGKKKRYFTHTKSSLAKLRICS